MIVFTFFEELFLFLFEGKNTSSLLKFNFEETNIIIFEIHDLIIFIKGSRQFSKLSRLFYEFWIYDISRLERNTRRGLRNNTRV